MPIPKWKKFNMKLMKMTSENISHDWPPSTKWSNVCSHLKNEASQCYVLMQINMGIRLHCSPFTPIQVESVLSKQNLLLIFNFFLWDYYKQTFSVNYHTSYNLDINYVSLCSTVPNQYWSSDPVDKSSNTEIKFCIHYLCPARILLYLKKSGRSERLSSL